MSSSLGHMWPLYRDDMQMQEPGKRLDNGADPGSSRFPGDKRAQL